MLVADLPLLAMTVEEFPGRFENWRRWCIQKGLHQGRVGSIEGAYRSPQHWDPPEPRPPMIDVLDALEVNRAYVRLAQLAPSYARAIQVLVFQAYIRPTRQAQMLGTHYLRLDALLHEAKQMLSNQLRAS